MLRRKLNVSKLILVTMFALTRSHPDLCKSDRSHSGSDKRLYIDSIPDPGAALNPCRCISCVQKCNFLFRAHYRIICPLTWSIDFAAHVMKADRVQKPFQAARRLQPRCPVVIAGLLHSRPNLVTPFVMNEAACPSLIVVIRQCCTWLGSKQRVLRRRLQDSITP